ncbi:MAG TPA: lysophospholipid acyltransferase family protein [Candidatus Limiplasma sp.]|nr:lysophospholipid acyltransferase family protein [Candidatus Limiplasma sp.]
MKHRIRQQVAWTFLLSVVRPFLWLITGYTYKRAKTIQGPAILMCNHNMDIDIGLMGLSYRQAMRVVASEHIFRLGILSSLVRLFFAPIVRMKGKTEIRTVREILNSIKKGGRVCIFPEGNRSFNGLTGEITRASASLVKMAKCQLITYRIEGGYLKHPRWARKGRHGRIFGHEVGRYSAAELANMSTEEVLAIIRRDLNEDAYARQRETAYQYTGKNLAESIEMALYLCPRCKKISTIRSRGDILFCSCGLAMRYTPSGIIESANGEKARFSTVTEWDQWQQNMTPKLTERVKSGPITEDAEISLFEVDPCKKEELIETGRLSMNSKELVCGSVMFPLQDISDLAIVGPNTLVFETKSGGYFELRSKSAYSALKYRRIFLHCKSTAKGECGVLQSVAQQ